MRPYEFYSKDVDTQYALLGAACLFGGSERDLNQPAELSQPLR